LLLFYVLSCTIYLQHPSRQCAFGQPRPDCLAILGGRGANLLTNVPFNSANVSRLVGPSLTAGMQVASRVALQTAAHISGRASLLPLLFILMEGVTLVAKPLLAVIDTLRCRCCYATLLRPLPGIFYSMALQVLRYGIPLTNRVTLTPTPAPLLPTKSTIDELLRLLP
jgi:hypothetical protein